MPRGRSERGGAQRVGPAKVLGTTLLISGSRRGAGRHRASGHLLCAQGSPLGPTSAPCPAELTLDACALRPSQPRARSGEPHCAALTLGGSPPRLTLRAHAENLGLSEPGYWHVS